MAAFRFAFLLDLAREAREDAARGMQGAQAAWQVAQGKLEQVNAYRQEYRNRLTQGGQGGMTILQWRDFQLFLAKLDQAADAQGREVVRLQAEYQRLKQVWFECEKKVKAFEALEHRHLTAEELKELKREQNLLDEFNTRRREH
ncbi:flagellar FliJ protein [Andreprevotia lacus DSM 23236]|uniref:Flagellar FliJ protein n=1 Tax=Andreprevotia lacus DSM 23236 TaxID=1121001 RepID=A0A1W1XAK3_9NEIS|nr:flagellar export protein FliJ [Andreprevotia lacus]SMC20551.1 flagellar FliJ protein [Andreprevotia lacus DSM 23236]